MSVKAVTYYTVECDAEGCTTALGDLGGDYAAWADDGSAIEDWTNSDGLILDDGDGECLCPKHAEAYRWCEHCGDERTKGRDANGDAICAACDAIEVSA
jgi:hypothetical protein